MEWEPDPGLGLVIPMDDVDSDEERERRLDPVNLPRQYWKTDEPIPEVDVALTHKKTGAPRAERAIALERQRKALRLQREQRTAAARALPVHTAPHGRPGGAYPLAAPWTPDEDAELLSILPLNIERPSWSEVTRKFTNATGNQRTLKSVRNRWNRLRDGRRAALAPNTDPQRAKNKCRICGLKKRGHVCKGVSAAPKTVNQMLVGVHRDMVVMAQTVRKYEDSDDGE